jgi:hypothetical protein
MVNIPPIKKSDDWGMLQMALFYPHYFKSTEAPKNSIPSVYQARDGQCQAGQPLATWLKNLDEKSHLISAL